MPITFSNRHDAKWSDYLTYVSVMMWFCSPAPPEVSSYVPCIYLYVYVIRLHVYQRGNTWCPILHICVPGPHHTVISIRNRGALNDTEKSVFVFKRKIQHGSFEEWVTGWWVLLCFIVRSEHWWYFHLSGIFPNPIDSLWGRQYFPPSLSLGRMGKQRQRHGSDVSKPQKKSETGILVNAISGIFHS